MFGSPVRPAMDDRFTIRPPPPAAISRPTARAIAAAPRTLTRRISSHSDRGVSVTGW
jgi:hypothetical protein